ncbi:MAG: tRNA 2-thiouridine(34) synthase MnmA [Candidatus Zambryskibacteria bacterium RIFOXYD1_FULL_40_13]|nr:MAG: tRNA-specific 2-thiouridylase MnmA [Parcubacteria group bacterium GW2011_GWC1_39_12]KKR19656.1 MAG: tRNA-specific 2-thiouridylase MnmA [Parcubacteria group bacterium GW2011_GWF1_39_37]KKR35812.1 MAG: tRNA-specific 2-thiouridylase MnmA [Parcubacteria group bacterium GW2011_GWC2_40_10]KKR52624.1 MAG: tRNA-specific 2-thiouridylase MnmA [Parcubacteria group bacterium GW2011_GWE1_40_20]KKR65028.1 MAG: tRNA-specific 2-thiouridylase MnmA [Parcubacteria group bacterium GW2011_GWB1_40_5]KKR6888
MNKKPKVFVGVSGGVDSSVALALLKKDGYDVTGVFLKVWHPDFLPCEWKEERRSAMRVCATMEVPFMTIDCETEYKKDVVDYMIREYSLGRVPNPDVFCNKYVKFGVFLKKALEMGADFIATGHYAQKYEHTNKYELKEGVDKNKDQSYFLYTLNQEQLQKVLFPIGHLTKPEVRKLALKFKLPTATKKDSQGLCFIGKVDMKDFLSHYIEIKRGDVLNTKNEVIGYHDGAMFYTIGQRHGFTITSKSNDGPRLFVISKDLEQNTIKVADKESDASEVYSVKELFLPEIHFISDTDITFPCKISARIRYRQEKQECTLEKKTDGFHILFNESQNGVPVGQSAVLYDGEVCLGGGVIEKTN